MDVCNNQPLLENVQSLKGVGPIYLEEINDLQKVFKHLKTRFLEFFEKNKELA